MFQRGLEFQTIEQAVDQTEALSLGVRVLGVPYLDIDPRRRMSQASVHSNMFPSEKWAVVPGPVMVLDDLMTKPEVPPPLRGRSRGSSTTRGVVSVRPSRRGAWRTPPTLILQLDLDGTVRFANEMFELVMGWNYGELKGLFASAILRPNDVVRDTEPENWQAYNDVQHGLRDSAQFETYLQARDGHAVHLAVTARLVRQHNFVQIEFEVLSYEPVLEDHRPQFDDPLKRMAFGEFLEAERQRKIDELAAKVDGLLAIVPPPAPTVVVPKHPGHRPLNPRLNTTEKFKAELEDAIRKAKDAWRPTRRGVCDRLGAKSENSLKDWLLFYDMLRHGSVARTLNEIAEELGLLGERFT